jgi:hypothetical protein
MHTEYVAEDYSEIIIGVGGAGEVYNTCNLPPYTVRSYTHYIYIQHQDSSFIGVTLTVLENDGQTHYLLSRQLECRIPMVCYPHGSKPASTLF